MCFEKKFDKLLEERRKTMLQKWNRVLPSNELLFDRFQKASFLGGGEGSSVYDSAVIMGDVVLGKNVWIGPFCVIEAINATIEIGDFCNISSAVHIYSHDSINSVLTSGRAAFRKGMVKIGNNTYIGSQSVIASGVTIGAYCVIGANTFVNKDVEDYSIVVGSPGKKIGKVHIKDDDVDFVYFAN